MDKLAPGGNFAKLNIIGLIIYAATFVLFLIFSAVILALDITLIIISALLAVQNLVYMFMKEEIKAKIISLRLFLVFIWGGVVVVLSAV